MEKKELNKLVKRLQSGEMEVFDNIYEETKKSVYYTILSILKSEEASEDLMQEVYIKILHSIHNYNTKNFNAWVVTIARNMAINEYNKNKKQYSVDPTESEYMFVNDTTTDEELLINDMRKYLKDVEFEIIMMHIIGNLTHKDISKIVDRPLGTVLWQYNQGIKKLKDKLEVR